MTSPIAYPVDDRDLLDDAALWAVIDSAAAAASKSLKRLSPYTSPPPQIANRHQHRTPPTLTANRFRTLIDGEVVQPPPKIARSHVSRSPTTSPMPIVTHFHHKTPTTITADPKVVSPPSTSCYGVEERESNNTMIHGLSGRFPSVSLFKEYQAAALAILEKSDYTLISGTPYIKKTGWRKISCYFNISYEIKDKTIEFDEDRNVQRAEFVVRAYMHGGRFSDGWGSCDRREKRFLKPNNDIPSTAETRAKNKACQDLLGIGGPGASRAKY